MTVWYQIWCSVLLNADPWHHSTYDVKIWAYKQATISSLIDVRFDVVYYCMLIHDIIVPMMSRFEPTNRLQYHHLLMCHNIMHHITDHFYFWAGFVALFLSLFCNPWGSLPGSGSDILGLLCPTLGIGSATWLLFGKSMLGCSALFRVLLPGSANADVCFFFHD